MNAKHLEQLPLQPDSATLPPSDTLIVAEELPSPTGNNGDDKPLTVAARREAWENKKPGSTLLRRLGNAPLLAGTAEFDAADQQEREVRQSMFETLKQLELEDDDANELLGSLVAEGPAALENAADAAANRRKPTPEELWEVIHGFRAMLEEKKQQQQQQQPKRQQASALVRASSIPEGLCSLQQFKQPQQQQ
uniref:Uncharacterized protein n=1 Tax=Macrostomum lignano TaxID=282301 RepID=A0A1I8G293_9PLAT